ncbi:MAG TPA: DUF4423 domain-containing protein [Polyangiaceae bacterium]|nr:DUF4423 domain-containing protein [Polyangiaceae bacterium]
MRFDWDLVSREFVRALRGSRSQTAFSRRLGSRTNVVYTWEAGRSFPTAHRALRAATRAGVDVGEALTRFYRAKPPWLSGIDPVSKKGIATLLTDLKGRTTILDLARASSSSRFAISRWLKGEAEPRLPDFFRLIEATSLRALDFLACFVDPAKVPSISKAWMALEAARRAAYDVPSSQAVLRCLELTDYRRLPKHRDGWIAERIGISPSEERRCLELLALTGQISKRLGLWAIRETRTVDTRRDATAARQVKSWWMNVASERMRANAEGIFSYNVFAVSEKDLERVYDLYRSYFQQIRSLIAQSEPSERVVVANIQLFPLDGAGRSQEPAALRRAPGGSG